jgi:hypothetical protein
VLSTIDYSKHLINGYTVLFLQSITDSDSLHIKFVESNSRMADLSLYAHNNLDHLWHTAIHMMYRMPACGYWFRLC